MSKQFTCTKPCPMNCHPDHECPDVEVRVPATAWFTVGFIVSMAILSAMVAIVRVG